MCLREQETLEKTVKTGTDITGAEAVRISGKMETLRHVEGKHRDM